MFLSLRAQAPNDNQRSASLANDLTHTTPNSVYRFSYSDHEH